MANETKQRLYVGGVFIGQLIGRYILFKITARDGDEIEFDYISFDGDLRGHYKTPLALGQEERICEVDLFLWDWLNDIVVGHTNETDLDFWVSNQLSHFTAAIGQYIKTHYNIDTNISK